MAALNALAVWEALYGAGVRLCDREGALELLIPEERDVRALEALGRTAGAHLWPLASGRWRGEIEGWPPAMHEAWQERAALREFEGGQGRDEAERAAFVEVREGVLAPHALILDALVTQLGAVLVAVEADEGREPAKSDPDDEPRGDVVGRRGT